jgi:predicted nucleic acid-binding protein
VSAATTVEVIQEFVHVRSRRRSRANAIALARHYAVALRLLVTRPEDLDFGLVLYERHQSLGAFDAMLAAVALNQQAEALVSADRAFGEVPHLLWIDPASPRLTGLVF